ncbi:MAG: glutathione synthase [Pseudomonadota bacterium]
MTLKIGIVMDAIQSINIKKDTGFAMLMTAQQRGYTPYYMEMKDLYVHNSIAYGTMKSLVVQEDQNHYFEFKSEEDKPLSDLDVILMRKDPPFDMEYIYATYILELAERSGTLVVNKPQSLRDANEKFFTTFFPDYVPPTLITRQAAKIRAFHQQHGDIILKPLNGMGGSSIFRLGANNHNISVIIETLTQHQSRYIMAQTYLPEITQGDKRIHIVNGECMPYCLARIPAEGETRGNIAAGGRGVAMPVSDDEKRVAQAVAPELKKRGLLFAGLDMIGDKITEINVTSPTCVKEIEAVYPIDIIGKLFDAIEQLL